MDAIVAYDLTKEYEGGRGALRRLNLQVPQGGCHGLRGPGKTPGRPPWCGFSPACAGPPAGSAPCWAGPLP